MFQVLLVFLGTARLLMAINKTDPASLQDFIVTSLKQGSGAVFDEALHREFRFQSVVCPDSIRCTDAVYHLEADPLVAVRRFFPGCCLPCSCDADCFNIGNCCPDVVSPTTSGLKMAEGGGLDCIRPDIWSYILKTDDDTMGRELRMFTDCAPGFDNVDTNISIKCLEPDSMNLTQVTPVTSLVTGRTYWNSDCAHCNDDSERLAAWNPVLLFHQMLTKVDPHITFVRSWATLVKEFHERSPKVMNLIFQCPASVEGTVTASVCPLLPSTIVTQCNSTGTWAKYDPFIEQACNSYRLPFEFKGRSFNNIFCFLCNQAQMKEGSSPSMCKIDFAPHRLSSLSIMGLLQPVSSADTDDPPTNGRCSCSEVWDTHKVFCRPLYCPQMESRVGCECRQFIKPLSGAEMRILLKVKQPNVSSLPQADLQDLATEINLHLRRKLQRIHITGSTFNGAPHNTSHYEFYLYSVSVQVLFGYDTKTVLRPALDMSFDVRSHDQSFHLHVTNTVRYFSTLSAIDLIGHKTLVTLLNQNMPIAFPFSKLLYCDQISLENDEYTVEQNVLQLNGTNKKSIFDFAFSSELEKTQICLEDYLSTSDDASCSKIISLDTLSMAGMVLVGFLVVGLMIA